MTDSNHSSYTEALNPASLSNYNKNPDSVSCLYALHPSQTYFGSLPSYLQKTSWYKWQVHTLLLCVSHPNWIWDRDPSWLWSWVKRTDTIIMPVPWTCGGTEVHCFTQDHASIRGKADSGPVLLTATVHFLLLGWLPQCLLPGLFVSKFPSLHSFF